MHKGAHGPGSPGRASSGHCPKFPFGLLAFVVIIFLKDKIKDTNQSPSSFPLRIMDMNTSAICSACG